MYQATTLHNKGMNYKEISRLLEVHEYPVKLALEASRRYPSKLLLRYLVRLADLDKDIKTGNITPQLGIELFILNV